MTTTLGEFRPGSAKARKPRKNAWTPPVRDELAYRQLLCFDPSLSATGFVALAHDADGLRVLSAATIAGEVPDGRTGWERDMAVAESLEDQLEGLSTRYSRHEWDLVTEQPPAGGGRIHQPQSAIMACKVVRSVFRRRGFSILPMFSPQGHRHATVGPTKLDKAGWHRELLPAVIEGLEVEGAALITNEAKRDAFSVGIAALRREGR